MSEFRVTQRGVLAVIYVAFIVFLIADNFRNWTGLTGLQRTSFTVALLILPSAKILKFLGIEFERETNETLSAMRQEFGRLEARILKLEERPSPPGPPTTKRQEITSTAHITVANPRELILQMLDDKAYSMRSADALQKATGLNRDALEAEINTMPRVQRYLGADNTVYYGFKDRAQSYWRRFQIA